MSSTTAVSRRGIALLDVIVGVWVLSWVVVGLIVGADLRELRQIGDTLDSSARAIGAVSDGLDALSNVPFAGEGLGDVAGTLDETAADVEESAAVTRSSLSELSVLITIAIAVIPGVPTLAGYLPYRVRRFRDRRALRRVLGDGADDQLERYLATRAVTTQPYHVLRAVSADPWGDLTDGRVDRLARIELDRLGLSGPIR